MYWLRRRLGTAGRARLAVIARVAGALPPADESRGARAGFSDIELERFSTSFRLANVASVVPWRGDADRLREIAWWGSALGDLACATRPEAQPQVEWESAAFNLGVALFDSVADRGGDLLPALHEALEPSRLLARVASATRNGARLECEDWRVEPIARLFDAALSGAARRLADRPRHLAYLSALLDSMYRSELGLSRDAFAAKTEPVVFIGALANDPADAGAGAAFRALAGFFQLWDDWQDLAEDLVAFAPNGFLGAGRHGGFAGSFAYAARAGARVAGGDHLLPATARRLAEALRSALDATMIWDLRAHRKAVTLCGELLR